MIPTREFFFLDCPPGQRYCVLDAPPGVQPRGTVLFVPPFAEEMNKSRRAVALACAALVEERYAVLRLDPYGTGDSSGEFAEASIARWQADLMAGAAWLSQRYGRVDWLWGLRLGAPLACRLATALPTRPGLLLWQPVVAGKGHFTQFLRMKLASEMLSAGQAQGGTGALRAQLAAGEAVEVGGYELSPTLAAELDALNLELPADYPGRVLWGEVAAPAEPTAEPALSPASRRVVEGWRAQGVRVEDFAATGLPFWQTQEIDEGRALTGATLARLFPA